MNLVESARKKILNGNFLTEDELSQEQYELITSGKATSQYILNLHDKLFGGNLSKIPYHNLLDGPFLSPVEEKYEELISDNEPPTEEFEIVSVHTL